MKQKKRKTDTMEDYTKAPICCGKFMRLASGRMGTCYYQCMKCGKVTAKDR